MPEEFLKTMYGKFRVKIENDIDTDQNTRETKKIGTMINVGGIRACVGINVPLHKDTAILLNVKRTGGGCEVDGQEISGAKTIGMINLAFTILKREYPYIRYIYLEDRSNIPCTLSNGSIVGVSLAGHQLIFHQQTWYEKYFNAYLIDPMLRDRYEALKVNFLKKPTEFNFYNDDIKRRLGPLLLESSSWKDFFSKVNVMENKCEHIFYWYNSALNQIFENINFTSQNWIIDLLNDKIKLVDYILIHRAGSRFTKKNNRYNTIKTIPLITSADISFDELMNYKYSPK